MKMRFCGQEADLSMDTPTLPVYLELQALRRKDAQTLTEALRVQVDYAIKAATSNRDATQERKHPAAGGPPATDSDHST